MASLREWVRGRRAYFAKIGHAIEGITVILLIALGAGAVGYGIAQSQARETIVEERANHQAEIERLQRTYTETLAIIAPQLKGIAKDVSQAATASAQAAVSTAEAAKSAKRAAAPVANAAPITEAQRSDTNRKIEEANRKVKDSK